MSILLIYATNSGTTQAVAQLIADSLTRAGHTVRMNEARSTNPDDLHPFDLVIFGSPSWDFNGKVGMPHEDFMPLMEKLRMMKFADKPFAIFGLGDTSYKIFCGAVNHLEKLVSDIGGKLATPSLRIDNYFSDTDGYNAKIVAWVTTLQQSFTT